MIRSALEPLPSGAGALLLILVALLGTACSSAPDPAAYEGHSTPSLQEPGQSIFGTVQEAVRMLEQDSTTDWSEVDVDRLRRHLIDMHNVALHVRLLEKQPLEHGVRIAVRPTTDSARASLRRVLSAHPAMLKQEAGWNMNVSWNDEEAVFRVRDPSGRAVQKIRALGYMGVLAYGAHHQRHHWMLVRGQQPESHT